MIKLALYQPDIPQNVGAMIRLAACTGADLEIIEPCGFPWNDNRIKQSAMDYLTHVNLSRHSSWQVFLEAHKSNRIILMTTKAEKPYIDFEFSPGDVLLAGQESTGVPGDIHESVDERLTIPMKSGLRSLNIVNATAMVLGEALRQTNGFLPAA